MSNFVSDIGCLNDEIMRLIAENSKLKQQENEEMEKTFENKIRSLLDEIKELTERNKMLENKVMKSVSADHYENEKKNFETQLKEVQDKLKAATSKLEIQQELTLKLKSHLPSYSEEADQNSQNIELKEKLVEALQQKSNLEMEISQMQINHQAEVDTLTDKVITLTKQLNEVTDIENNYKEAQNTIAQLQENAKIYEQVKILNKRSLNHEITLRTKAEQTIEEMRNQIQQFTSKFESEFATSQTVIEFLSQLLNCVPTEIVSIVQNLLVVQESKNTSDLKMKEMQERIKELSDETTAKKDYVKDLQEERTRSEELARELAIVRQTVIEQNEQIELLKEESDKKIDELQQLHDIETRNFQDELDAANTKISQLEQIKVPSSIKSNKSSNRTTPILSKSSLTPVRSGNTTPIRSLLKEAAGDDTDANYLQNITDFIDIVSNFCRADEFKENEGMKAVGDLFAFLIERPFNQDGALAAVESMVDILKSTEISIRHTADIKDAIVAEFASFSDDVSAKIAELEEQIVRVQGKMKSTVRTKKPAKSKIPMFNKRAGEPILSPSRRNLVDELNQQSVRIRF